MPEPCKQHRALYDMAWYLMLILMAVVEACVEKPSGVHDLISPYHESPWRVSTNRYGLLHALAQHIAQPAQPVWTRAFSPLAHVIRHLVTLLSLGPVEPGHQALGIHARQPRRMLGMRPCQEYGSGLASPRSKQDNPSGSRVT